MLREAMEDLKVKTEIYEAAGEIMHSKEYWDMFFAINRVLSIKKKLNKSRKN